MIPFNKPFLTGKETDFIREAVASGQISGDGIFTQKCHRFFEEKYNYERVLLTNSCTDALNMAAILCEIEPGDEVIAPSYTFVSTVNAFVLRGAKIVFADCQPTIPNIDPTQIEALITPRTKALVVVHYSGIACEMDEILEITRCHGLLLIEDSAHSIDSYYKGRPLGSLGTFGAFSFHETKNIISGEGGMLTINDKKYESRAEIIREKGTNRSAFFRGEIDKYSWVDIGSSFLPSDIIAAFLYAQLLNIDKIQKRRYDLWNLYRKLLEPLRDKGFFNIPEIPPFATNNGHMFYIVCRNHDERSGLIKHLKANNILAVFHYLPLHESPFYRNRHDGRQLPNTKRFARCLLRLPLYYELEDNDVYRIAEKIKDYFS